MKLKKLYFIFISIFIFSLSSCNKDSEVKNIKKNDTIKFKTNDFEKRIRWTNELEQTRMTKSYKQTKSVNSSIPLTPDVMAIINKSEKIYPIYRQGFSLDISGIPENQKKSINDFCKAFAKDPFSGPEQYFDSNFMFNYVFYIKSFISFWENKKGEKIDILKDKKNESDSENKSDDEEEKKENDFFTDWKIGKPEYSKDLINFPVRFFYNTGNIDVIIEMSSETLKILNIH